MSTVKKKKVYNYIFKGEEIVDEILHSEQDFDSDGNLIKSLVYGESGEVDTVEQTEYDAGNLVYWVAEDKLMDTFHAIEQKWEGDLLIESVERHSEHDHFVKSIFKYNETGKLLEKRIIDDEGLSGGAVLYEYEGNTIIMEEYDEEGELVLKRTTSLDGDNNAVDIKTIIFEDGNTIEEIILNEYKNKKVVANTKAYRAGKLVYEAVNTTNDKDEATEQIYTDYLAGVETKIQIHQNQEDRIIKEEEFVNGVLNKVSTSRYNENDDAVEEKYYAKANGDYFNVSGAKIEIEYW